MSNNCKIEFNRNRGNLNVSLKGDFDGSSAWELIHLLHEQYDGEGYVFIDTKQLRTIRPFGGDTFRNCFNPGRLPKNRLFFKGEKGFEIAPTGCKILVVPKRRTCDGTCRVCTCSDEKEQAV